MLARDRWASLTRCYIRIQKYSLISSWVTMQFVAKASAIPRLVSEVRLAGILWYV
jgi:hypothetical protein